RLERVEHLGGIDAAERLVRIERRVERPMLAERKRLRKAEGGEAARPIFGDVLHVARQRDLGAGPGLDVEADPGGARIDLVALGDLTGADELDALAQRIAGGEALLRREVDASLLAADRD